MTVWFNIRGIAHGAFGLEVLLATLVLATVLYVFRYGDFSYRLAAILTGGLLLSRHLTISDAALLIPVALMLGFHPAAGISRVVAIFLVSPVSYLLSVTPVAAEFPRVLLLALACLLAWDVRMPRHGTGVPPGFVCPWPRYLKASKPKPMR